MAISRQLFLLVGQRTPYLVDERDIARAKRTEIYPCLGKAQCAVWPTSHFVGVMVVLTVILPETNRA